MSWAKELVAKFEVNCVGVSKTQSNKGEWGGQFN